jgi:hypothetical protein
MRFYTQKELKEQKMDVDIYNVMPGMCYNISAKQILIVRKTRVLLLREV